jgi:DNA-binding PadR family transcriptional regulator
MMQAEPGGVAHHGGTEAKPALPTRTRTKGQRERIAIAVPKGMLRLAALKLLSESSMSGIDLSQAIQRVTLGAWKPGPGSIYLILGELLKKGLITELPKRGGNVRRYIISGKGKEELARLARASESDVTRQLRLLAVYSGLAGRGELKDRMTAMAEGLGSSVDPGKA